jgi:RecG-like helicase
MREYSQGKTVIYYSSMSKVQVLVKVLCYNRYYYDAEDKDKKLQSFIQGKKKIIIATSVLRLGIDIPDI